MLYSLTAFFTIYIVAGFLIIAFFSARNRYSRLENEVLIIALLFRLGMTYFYYVYIMAYSGDALEYFLRAEKTSLGSALPSLLQPGTSFIFSLTTIVYQAAKYFPNPFLMCFIPYSLLGLTGSLIFYQTLRTKFLPAKGRRQMLLFFVAFFLPNMIFWSSNVGKDSLIYFGVIGLTSLIVEKKPLALLLKAIFFGAIVYMIRPHILLFASAGAGLGFFMSRSKFSIQTIIPGLIAFASILLIYDKAFTFIGLKTDMPNARILAQAQKSQSIETSLSFLQQHAKDTDYGGAASGVQPLKWFGAPWYVVRFIGAPFIWEARKPLQILAGLESTIYQIMMIYLIINWRSLKNSSYSPYRYCLLLYLILTSVIFGAAYSNFGLTTRQRCQVIPQLIILFLIAQQKKSSQIIAVQRNPGIRPSK